MDHSKVNILSLKTTGDHPMLEEHLAKIATALRLFMQGLGFGELALHIFGGYLYYRPYNTCTPFCPAPQQAPWDYCSQKAVWERNYSSKLRSPKPVKTSSVVQSTNSKHSTNIRIYDHNSS
jgi:hypothetical protein